MPFYPDISATTPKVSLFNFSSQGEELINASVKQVDEFFDIATTKVGFMTKNQEQADSTVKFIPCVIQNATGVRLSLVDFTKGVGYPAPALIEPGECASFLGGGEKGTIKYQVQVFEGPVAFGGDFGGWQVPSKAGIPRKDVSIPTFQLEYQNTEIISYGAKIQLVNQFAPAGYGRYLDTNGVVGNTNPQSLGVRTSPEPDLDNGSGTWKIVRDDLSGSGPVRYGDKVKLVNQYSKDYESYLDTYGVVGDTNPQSLGVRTSPEPNRDNGSGTWKIILQQEAVTPSTAPAFAQDMKNPKEPFETKLVWTRNDQALPVNVFKITQQLEP